jgi:predicted phosphodiesterase
MIFITGDTHSDVERFSTNSFPEQKEMTKDDYVIICGDFGLVWSQTESKTEKYWLDWLENKPFTTLFVDGNHENFDRLYNYPVDTWHGGKVHKIRPSVIHLMRGEVFDLQGKTFFAFGGASSHDIRDGILEPTEVDKIKAWQKDRMKLFRVNHVSWWEQELPSDEELTNGLENLKAHNNTVDFIITHSPSTSCMLLLGMGLYTPDKLTNYLEEIRATVNYKYWFFGHMHDNKQINRQDGLLYEQIVRIV